MTFQDYWIKCLFRVYCLFSITVFNLIMYHTNLIFPSRNICHEVNARTHCATQTHTTSRIQNQQQNVNFSSLFILPSKLNSHEFYSKRVWPNWTHYNWVDPTPSTVKIKFLTQFFLIWHTTYHERNKQATPWLRNSTLELQCTNNRIKGR